jgi:hypothetical protein
MNSHPGFSAREHRLSDERFRPNRSALPASQRPSALTLAVSHQYKCSLGVSLNPNAAAMTICVDHLECPDRVSKWRELKNQRQNPAQSFLQHSEFRLLSETLFVKRRFQIVFSLPNRKQNSWMSASF